MKSEKSEMLELVKGINLSVEQQAMILKFFGETYTLSREWEKKAKKIVVTHEDDTIMMSRARQGRLELREHRIAVERIRVELKERSLREGQAIQKIANYLKDLITPLEQHLDKQEKWIQYRDAAIEKKRLEAEAEKERLRLEQEERDQEIQREKDRKESERIRKENEKLRMEQEKKDRELREAQDKINQAEREKKRIAEESRKEMTRKLQEQKEKIYKKKPELIPNKEFISVTCPGCGLEFKINSEDIK